MGYFSNGTEGEMYQCEWCVDCIHDDPENEIYCPIWGLHLEMNYAECNNKESILHRLIPREELVGNGKCVMFVKEGDTPARGVTDADREYKAWQQSQKATGCNDE